jgi:hypothetical protein
MSVASSAGKKSSTASSSTVTSYGAPNVVRVVKSERLDGRLAPDAASTSCGELLAGYGAAGGALRDDLVATHTAVGLLCLAVEPFRLRQPEWPARTEALLEAARSWSPAGTGAVLR